MDARDDPRIKSGDGHDELLLYELIGVQLVDRRLFLDNAFFEIEILQLGQARGIDRAEFGLSRINQLVVIFESIDSNYQPSTMLLDVDVFLRL